MKPSGPDRPTLATRRLLPSERLGAQRPAFTRTLAAFAAGLQMDPAARSLGEHDAAGGYFRLSVEDIKSGRTDLDVLAYLRGWLDRKRRDKRREG